MKNSQYKNYALTWIITVVASIVLLFIGNRLATKELDLLGYTDATLVAKVSQLGECIYDTNDSSNYTEKIQIFYATVTKGQRKGESLIATQETDNYSYYQEDPVKVGDKVLLYENSYSTTGAEWIFGGYYRINYIIILAVAFIMLVLIFGKAKGVNTLISLGFTICAVFCFFVPVVLSGANIYVMTTITCIYTIVMTLLITNGPSQKSLTTIIGCSFGVLVSSIITIILIKIMHLTGITDEHSVYLMYLSNGVEIDLRALIFAMSSIGAMGAVMDVAMDISSSLSEIHKKIPDISLVELFNSGIRIGKDIMGTMANTLVLAYVGSSLCSTLLMVVNSASLLELLNREGVIVELLQTLVGSLSLLLTIPLTSIVCSVIYTKKGNK